MVHRVADILADLLGGAFSRLQCDIARESLGHDDVDGALAKIVSLDEPVIVEMRQTGLTPRDISNTLRLDLAAVLEALREAA